MMSNLSGLFSALRHVGLNAAISKLPEAEGKRFVNLFNHGSLSVELYAPRDNDPQKPHTRDEIYVVARGSGTFVCGPSRMSFVAGDVLFAAAGEVHRFEEFTDDFHTWVFFYGPQGGEHPVDADATR